MRIFVSKSLDDACVSASCLHDGFLPLGYLQNKNWFKSAALELNARESVGKQRPPGRLVVQNGRWFQPGSRLRALASQGTTC